MAVKIGHASIDENGKITGGSAGDQNGKEVKISNWYENEKGWVVLRCRDAVRRGRIADAMEKACNNSQIGYDQNQRNSLLNNVKTKGFDPSKTTKKVETDCSALIRVCIAYAYGWDLAGNIRTADLPDVLVKTGEFEKLTDEKYCKTGDYLLRGDILCTPVKGHAVTVLRDGVKIVKEPEITHCDVSLPCLLRGHKRAAVKAMQILLIGYGYSCGEKGVDGSFGAATETAVKQFQKDRALTVDGECGPKTWTALLGG